MCWFVCLCSLSFALGRGKLAHKRRREVEAWEPETLSTGPLLGPEIVQILAKCWGGDLQSSSQAWYYLFSDRKSKPCTSKKVVVVS